MKNNSKRVALLASLCLFLLPAAAGAAPTEGQRMVDAIADRLYSGDCKDAVERLKAGLKEGHREVELMGGTMFEHGVCLPRDWKRAVALYLKAYTAGQPDASERLAAGYADPANGPDIAAALWWAARGRGFAGDACRVAGEAADDPDRFVAVLATWPQARLAHCTYIAGVLATISSETKYPAVARALGVGGEVTLRFLPGVPRIELQKGESHEYTLLGWVNGDALRDRGAKPVTGSFEKTLSEVANRALRRYPHPAGIPVDTLFQVKFSFTLE